MPNPKRTIALLALSAAACGDGVTAPTREITLYFCGVVWAAHQHYG